MTDSSLATAEGISLPPCGPRQRNDDDGIHQDALAVCHQHGGNPMLDVECATTFPASTQAIASMERSLDGVRNSGGHGHQLSAAILEEDEGSIMESTLGEPLVIYTTNPDREGYAYDHGGDEHEAMRDIPSHDWRHEFCDCFHLVGTPACCNAFCFPQLLLGQVMNRMGLDWKGSAPDNELDHYACNPRVVLVSCFGALLVSAILTLLAARATGGNALLPMLLFLVLPMLLCYSAYYIGYPLFFLPH